VELVQASTEREFAAISVARIVELWGQIDAVALGLQLTNA
jgi:predicted ester cyclase